MPLKSWSWSEAVKPVVETVHSHSEKFDELLCVKFNLRSWRDCKHVKSVGSEAGKNSVNCFRIRIVKESF